MTISRPATLPERKPEPGELVLVRSRHWLVEAVRSANEHADGPAIVTLACAEDDAQGEMLEVFWDFELDRHILDAEAWGDLASRGFDSPRFFSAFLHTMRWNCVTATDPQLFQAPFRAGIHVDAYQMEPLRKALRLPRVNLFIADDTGLGKTIEAGLIARELLLRKRAKTIIVAAPPSVLEQWKGELEERFGLLFQILDRKYVSDMRREHGFGVNPWRTHSRFLVSHNLLTDSSYTDPLRELLGSFLPGSLLILDEAHHAAPSSGGKYGIETKFTRAIRDLATRFEHRLFLSATPHNGHSNSFSTLLELLDPYRFTRGVKTHPKALEPIMVRRLKEDLRALQGGFPIRRVERVSIDGLPEDAPELVLSRLLDQYRSLREQRFAATSRRTQASAGLLIVGLQQRLLSSIEAFARSLAVHRKTVERQWAKAHAATPEATSGESDEIASLFAHSADADDERGTWTDEDVAKSEDEELEALSAALEASSARTDAATALWHREQALLDEMERVAETARWGLDGKASRLIEWIREHMCPGLPLFGTSPKGSPPSWNRRRIIVFTENREGTKRYLKNILTQAIEGTDRADERIEVIDGLTTGARRQEVQRRFNTDPDRDPLRILLATDAAREGLNFQAHCADLFHFDLPWNPGRIEQRNGRIDRKLQPAAEVRCHYFVLPQRTEDRVLEVLVRKTETIKRELGSLSKVIDDQIERKLLRGIRHSEAQLLAEEIDRLDLDQQRRQTADEELEAARARQQDLKEQIDRCQRILGRSKESVGFEREPFQHALSAAFELLGASGLIEHLGPDGDRHWRVPDLDQLATSDPSWNSTLDTLRTPRDPKMALTEWRRKAPIRPVVFEDPGIVLEDVVHLHLEQRLAQRLLSRFRSQGFVHTELSRACLAHTQDSVPRVILLGRLSLYGARAERLHEEIVPVSARWSDPSLRKQPLTAYARTTEDRTLTLLDEALGTPNPRSPDPVIQQRLLAAAPRDIQELLPQLEPRAVELRELAVEKLRLRGDVEARELREILEGQHQRVSERIIETKQIPLYFDSEEEKRQFEADQKAWPTRLQQLAHDLEHEPARIRDFYEVRSSRIEPIGLVYLWPESN